MPHRVKILAQNMYIERVLCIQLNGIEGRLKEMACKEIKWNTGSKRKCKREQIYLKVKREKFIMHRNEIEQI